MFRRRTGVRTLLSLARHAAIPAAVAFASSNAHAASLSGPITGWASGVPSYISMYEYVPDKLAASPPILVVAHFCGGSASAVFGQAQGGGLVAAADKYGFIMIFPQTTNAASSAKCWDVGSKASLTHDGGGDTQAVAEMVKYSVTKHNANAARVYATGDSSGGMMTQALLAVYPDVFKAGSSFAGVPAGCWSDGWSAASNWGGTCAGGNDIMTAAQWGALVKGMYPTYTGHRPRVQLFHGDADPTISFKNFGEAIKEWTNVLGLSTAPTTTTTGLTLGTHQATRQQWKNSCGYVVLDAFTSIGGDHGPSDTLFNATYVVPFMGLDNTSLVDPEIAACGNSGGTGGAAGGSGNGGASSGGASNNGGTSNNGGSGGSSLGGTASSSGGSSGSSLGGDASNNGGSGGSSFAGAASTNGGNSSLGGAASSGDHAGGSGGAVAPAGGSAAFSGTNGDPLVEAGSQGQAAAPSPGCSCHVTRRSDSGSVFALAGLLALGATWRRRRRS